MILNIGVIRFLIIVDQLLFLDTWLPFWTPVRCSVFSWVVRNKSKEGWGYKLFLCPPSGYSQSGTCVLRSFLEEMSSIWTHILANKAPAWYNLSSGAGDQTFIDVLLLLHPLEVLIIVSQGCKLYLLNCDIETVLLSWRLFLAYLSIFFCMVIWIVYMHPFILSVVIILLMNFNHEHSWVW